MLEFLPALGQREAIAFGDGVALPVRIKFDELPKAALPRSSTARFSERWQASVGDEGFLEQIVERWRSAGTGFGGDTTQQVALFAEAMGLTPSPQPEAAPAAPRIEAAPYQAQRPIQEERPVLRQREQLEAAVARQNASPPRPATQQPPAATPQTATQRRPATPPRREGADEDASSSEAAAGDSALKQLRDRLMQRSGPAR
jgi:hypothetical protein